MGGEARLGTNGLRLPHIFESGSRNVKRVIRLVLSCLLTPSRICVTIRDTDERGTEMETKALKDMTLAERDALSDEAWETLEYDENDDATYIGFVVYVAAPLPVRPSDSEVVIYEGATEYVTEVIMGALSTGMANDVANDLARFDGCRLLGVVVAADGDE